MKKRRTLQQYLQRVVQCRNIKLKKHKATQKLAQFKQSRTTGKKDFQVKQSHRNTIAVKDVRNRC